MLYEGTFAMAINALVIDDSGIMRKMVMRTLEETGLAEFDFTEAEDGVVGLERFNPRATDIVFVDWNMPNMSGVELVKRLRAQYPKKRVPIVMVTTETLAGKMEEAFSYGADSFMSKPFRAEELEFRRKAIIEQITEEQGKGGFFKRMLA